MDGLALLMLMVLAGALSGLVAGIITYEVRGNRKRKQELHALLIKPDKSVVRVRPKVVGSNLVEIRGRYYVVDPTAVYDFEGDKVVFFYDPIALPAIPELDLIARNGGDKAVVNEPIQLSLRDFANVLPIKLSPHDFEAMLTLINKYRRKKDYTTIILILVMGGVLALLLIVMRFLGLI